MKVGECNLVDARTCKKEDSVKDIAITMKDKKVRHIFVIDENEYPVGIISTTDMTNKVVADAMDANSTKAENVMTSPLDVCDINDDLVTVYMNMSENNRLSCPVVEEGKLKGLLIFREAFKEVMKLKKGGTLWVD